MAAGGIKNAAVLDELESHLREDVERQVRAGASAERSFEIAVQRIGPATALKSEFRKTNLGGVLEKLMIAAAALVMAFGAFLSVVTLLLCYPNTGERLMGFLAIGATFGTAWGWPAVVSHFPIIYPKKKRQLMEILCLAAGFGASTFYVQLILPYFEHRADGMLPPIGFLAIFPVAVGFALAAGLETAVRQKQIAA